MNSFTLKLIASITMVIDHVGMAFFPELTWLRIIGRAAFPIYCFLLVVGYFHTRDIKKYLLRLLIFGALSEIQYDLVRYDTFFTFRGQNVYFTLTLGLLAVFLVDKIVKTRFKILAPIPAIIIMAICESLHCDYGYRGIGIILCFYIWFALPRLFTRLLLLLPLYFFNYGGIQPYAMVAVIPLYFYNGRKGPDAKYAFYGVYPVHLLLLAIIKRFMMFRLV